MLRGIEGRKEEKEKAERRKKVGKAMLKGIDGRKEEKEKAERRKKVGEAMLKGIEGRKGPSKVAEENIGDVGNQPSQAELAARHNEMIRLQEEAEFLDEKGVDAFIEKQVLQSHFHSENAIIPEDQTDSASDA